MNRDMRNRLIVPYTLLSVAAFLVLSWRLPPDKLIVTMNSLFIGSMVAITVAYGRIIINSVRGRMSYPDVQQLVIGILMSAGAYGITVMSSVYVRANDMPATTLFITAFGRWLAINGTIIQITAPDYGEGLFFGRDRQLLWFSLATGAAFAIATFIIQDYGNLLW